MANVNVAIENGVFIGKTQGYITVVQNGEVIREYLTPRYGEYVRYWHGEGIHCQGKQQFGAGGGAWSWPSSDVEECAKFIAKCYRMKYLGKEAR